MSTTINGVTVRLERDPSEWRKYQVVVQVASRVRIGLKTSATIDPGTAVDSTQLMKGIAAAASLGAEQLDRRYKDQIDPALAIRDALRAFGEECRLIAELGKDLPAKLARLRQFSGLTAQEHELIGRMCYLVDRGDGLTRTEVEWVNQRIGRIHGSSL